MKIQLYNTPSINNAKIQCLINRSITNVNDYLKNSYDNINKPTEFDENLLKSGAKMIFDSVQNQERIHIIQDCDVDGMMSAAIMINYLYELFPNFVESNVSWSIHKEKGHGIDEFINTLEKNKYGLLIVPDAGTNDHESIKRLHDVGTKVLILDHHLSERGFSPYAVTINSQYDYPNPELSGAGVVLKFCQYIDTLLNKNIADKFKDLAATALQADMMDIRSLETKQMIFEGLKEENIINPLLYNICDKNAFSFNKDDYKPSEYNGLKVTPIGMSFFCVPLLNAVCRSGNDNEKELIFNSLLTHKAFNKIPSTKRGHKLNEMEMVVTQATRQLTNIKNRQDKSVAAGMEFLDKEAQKQLQHQVMVFCLEPEDMEGTIRGLCANKLMAKYQRPVCVTTRLSDGTYAGSMRGYTATGIESFKDIAEQSKYCTQVIGHANAAGIFLTDPGAFVDNMDEILSGISTDIVYYVDYMWDANSVNNEAIIDLAEMNDYIGTGFPRPLVYIHDVLIDNFMFMKEKHLKINLPNGCSAIIWDAPEELRERLLDGEVIKINFVAKCCKSTWNWEVSPQLIIEDYEEIETSITESWGF